MGNNSIIWIAFLAFVLLLLIILEIRNTRIYNYRVKIADQDYREAIENLKKGKYSGIDDKYSKLPSYSTMLWYFWIPLTDENWIGFSTLKDYYKRKIKK